MRVPVVLLTLAMLAGIARADDREDARREFAAGQTADKQKDWQGAIEHYLRANDLVPHPFAMFNIATDYERLNQLREAAKWYERYLQAATDSPDREKVARTLSELRTRPAALSVRSMPDGAQVTIDGAPAGKTPLDTTVKGGMHKVAVDHQGQHDERDVELEYGEPQEVAFTLAGGSGTLYVYGTPVGAYVAVDNVTVGTMPANVPLPAGKHALRVTAYGYTTQETTVVVQPNQATQTAVTLPRGLGSLDTTTTGPTIQIGYLIGVTGGADVKDGSGLVLADFGARAGRFEGAVRVGHVSGGTGVDFTFRWAFFDTRVSPFLAVGYAYGNNAFGYAAQGGLRWDVTRGERIGLSLLADLGVRWFSGTDTMGTAVSGLAYPLSLSLEVVYR